MKGKKVFRLNKLFYIFAALILILAVGILSMFLRADDRRISLFYSPAKNGAVVLSAGEDRGVVIPGKSISCVRYNADSTACAVLMSDGSSYSLYKIYNGAMKKISDDCTSNIVCASSGKTVAYTTSDGHFYCGKDLIDESVEFFSMSPECTSAIYSKKVDGVNKLYLWLSGKTISVSENYIPLAVSDDGEYLYVLSGDNSLCMLNSDGTMKSKICSDVQTDSFRFSEDMQSVVFSDGSYTYISVQGKSRIRLMQGIAAPAFSETDELRLNSIGNAFVYADDFAGNFYFSESDDGTKNLFYVDENFGKTDIAGSVRKFIITGDKSLVYLDSMGKIYKYNGSISELVVSGASDFEATSNNKYIYYITTAHEIFSVKRNNTQLIATGAEKMYMTGSDDLLIIMTDKTLYSVSGTKRSDIIASDVMFCDCEGDIAFYATAYNNEMGTFELYSSNNNKKFHFAVDGVIKNNI